MNMEVRLGRKEDQKRVQYQSFVALAKFHRRWGNCKVIPIREEGVGGVYICTCESWLRSTLGNLHSQACKQQAMWTSEPQSKEAQVC